MSIDPVCLIHGKKASEHEGGRCLYCCICFKPLTPDECAEDHEGNKWDVCKGACAEESGIKEKHMTITEEQYEAICAVIDAVKLDEFSKDSDDYAFQILAILNIKAPA